jgi:hypothetical protein
LISFEMLKVHLHEIFILNWFGQKNPSELLNKHLKYFWFWLWIRRDIQIFVHFTYYQNKEIFPPRIIRIRKFSFRVLSVYIKYHSTYYLLLISFSWNGKYVFSVWVKFCSSYSHYMLYFISPILVTSSISFRVLSV